MHTRFGFGHFPRIDITLARMSSSYQKQLPFHPSTHQRCTHTNPFNITPKRAKGSLGPSLRLLASSLTGAAKNTSPLWGRVEKDAQPGFAITFQTFAASLSSEDPDPIEITLSQNARSKVTGENSLSLVSCAFDEIYAWSRMSNL